VGGKDLQSKFLNCEYLFCTCNEKARANGMECEGWIWLHTNYYSVNSVNLNEAVLSPVTKLSIYHCL